MRTKVTFWLDDEEPDESRLIDGLMALGAYDIEVQAGLPDAERQPTGKRKKKLG